jgi:hypothetical protein
VTARRKPSASGPPKQVDTHAAVLQIATPVIAAPPPPTGVFSSKVVSTAKSWDYSRRVTEFLERLKNREADREGYPFFPFATSTF